MHGKKYTRKHLKKKTHTNCKRLVFEEKKIKE